MQRTIQLIFLICFLQSGLNGQVSIRGEKTDLIKQARARYYNPISKGLTSFTCNVRLDLDTVPTVLLLPAEAAGRKPPENTKIQVTMGIRKAIVQTVYPKDVPSLMVPVYDKFFQWVNSVITGFFETWGSKGMGGPIPYVDDISNVTPNQNGFLIAIDHPGNEIEVKVTKDYRVTEILTKGKDQEFDEHPTFTASPYGLLFTGNKATNKQGKNVLPIQYDVNYQRVQTFQLPHNIHLVAGDNINMKFALENCSTVQGIIVHVLSQPAK